jgi:hypothetical protein
LPTPASANPAGSGKALTPQEKRRVKYYNSPIVKEADWLARRCKWYFTEMGILSAGQISRLKHVESVPAEEFFVSLSFHHE